MPCEPVAGDLRRHVRRIACKTVLLDPRSCAVHRGKHVCASSGGHSRCPEAQSQYPQWRPSHRRERGHRDQRPRLRWRTSTESSQARANDEHLFSQNMKDVFFAYDRYSVPQNEQTAVEQDARFLAAHPNYRLLISSHCDERGSEDYNLALGDNRADAVRDQLERLGISAGRIRTISYGKEKPFCTEETEACWQLNRRAHFSMQR